MSSTPSTDPPSSASSGTTFQRPSLAEVARSKTSFTWRRPFPTYIATSSRGSVPHLTSDNIRSHTKIGSVHVGLEDFLNGRVANSPILGIEIPLQKYLAYPESTEIILSARRANPVPINSSWDDKIEIQTVDGRNPLPVDVFFKAVKQMKLRSSDTVVSIPDFTEQPGAKRLMKMVERTQRWLNSLLKCEPECKIIASIPPIPPTKASGLLDDYMEFLAENGSLLSGVAIYNFFPNHPITQFLPDQLSQLPILQVPSPVTPHEILSAIISDEVGLFTAGGMITAMSDLGIALDFQLSPTTEQRNIHLGRDMFLPENEAVMGPLVEGCECFTCKNHYRAYIHHLLKCHEMTAWKLSDKSHNFHVLDLFFEDIQKAIESNTLLEAAEKFDKTYTTADIIEPGSRGPRVRGHHTTLRRDQKKRKQPIANNTGVVGKDTSVYSGGEIIEREGKRKHWRQFEDDDGEGITNEGMEIVDEEERVEGMVFPEGEVEMDEAMDEVKENGSQK